MYFFLFSRFLKLHIISKFEIKQLIIFRQLYSYIIYDRKSRISSLCFISENVPFFFLIYMKAHKWLSISHHETFADRERSISLSRNRPRQNAISHRDYKRACTHLCNKRDITHDSQQSPGFRPVWNVPIINKSKLHNERLNFLIFFRQLTL